MQVNKGSQYPGAKVYYDAAEWASVDPTLPIGVTGVEIDTGKEKDGDGSTAWSSLPYKSVDGAASIYRGIVRAVASANGNNIDLEDGISTGGVTTARVGNVLTLELVGYAFDALKTLVQVTYLGDPANTVVYATVNDGLSTIDLTFVDMAGTILTDVPTVDLSVEVLVYP